MGNGREGVHHQMVNQGAIISTIFSMLSKRFFILDLAASLTYAAPNPESEYEHVNIANVPLPLSVAPLNKTLAYYRQWN